MNVCRVYVHLYVASVLVYLIDLRVTCPVSLKMPRVVCVRVYMWECVCFQYILWCIAPIDKTWAVALLLCQVMFILTKLR